MDVDVIIVGLRIIARGIACKHHSDSVFRVVESRGPQLLPIRYGHGWSE